MKNQNAPIFILILTLMSLLGVRAHGEITMSSGKNQVAVVELFSSEGCSSCPPADQWMASLRSNSGLWKTFIPMEFHVDYWNQLGWIDPFSKNQFTERQRMYAALWRIPKVYTPGFVLNGEEFFIRSNWEQKLVRRETGELAVKQIKANRFSVQFKPTSDISKKYAVHAAVLGNGLESKIPAGENAGKTLRHEFVALHLSEAALSAAGPTHKGEFIVTLPNNLKAKSYSLVFWVTSGDSPIPIQAVGQDVEIAKLLK